MNSKGLSHPGGKSAKDGALKSGEREREREREHVCVCVRGVCVRARCVCVRARVSGCAKAVPLLRPPCTHIACARRDRRTHREREREREGEYRTHKDQTGVSSVSE